MLGASIPGINRTPAVPCLHLLYHELRPGPDRYSYSIETATFETHVDLIDGAGRVQTFGVSAEFTFDDGHSSHFEIALPILQSHELQARFFITAGWTGRKSGYMGWHEVRCLSDAGHIIGAHGWSHALLTHCSQTELDREIHGSKNLLEDKLGTPIATMSLPGGRYNKRVLAACQDAGYTKVYTSVPRIETTASEFLVGRVNISSRRSRDWIKSLFQPDSAELADLQGQYRLKEAARTILGDWCYSKMWASVTRKEPESEEDTNESP